MPKIDFRERYPATENRGISLLERMLEFDPATRISASEALLDSYFDEIRIPEHENVPPPYI
jgi:serine/threonine protein kinase